MRIELRWMKTGDGHDDSPLEYKLQFKYTDDTGNINHSDWMDIPVFNRQGKYLPLDSGPYFSQ
jgi:hypothetical protein